MRMHHEGTGRTRGKTVHLDPQAELDLKRVQRALSDERAKRGTPENVTESQAIRTALRNEVARIEAAESAG